MTTARLSPAANLLRNSKLFALPPAVPLPPPKASSDVVPGSDTATTVYPTRAAIETPLLSLHKGDWGLKRSLPLRSTTRSGSPVIRLRKGIDTAEHITDFESAGDHVVTLQKWQEIGVQMSIQPKNAVGSGSVDRRQFSVFHPGLDNATNKSEHTPKHAAASPHAEIPAHLQESWRKLVKDREAEAKAGGRYPTPRQPEPLNPTLQPKRWRYNGPWLAGMTDIQFDAYLKNIAEGKIAQFKTHLKERLAAKREAERQVRADEERAAADSAEYKGKAADVSVAPVEVTDEEVTEYLRQLRSKPQEFGPEIARFLDLPEGPDAPSIMPIQRGSPSEWYYSRETVAADPYKKIGPPRTHPSAGFSYVRSKQYARNDPVVGPQEQPKPVAARVLKDNTMNRGSDQRRDRGQSIGVGGIVARLDDYTHKTSSIDMWEPQAGGTRTVVKVVDASVQQNGALEITVQREREWQLDSEEVPFNKQERNETPRSLPPVRHRMVYLDGYRGQETRSPSGRTRGPTKMDENTDAIFEQFNRSFGGKG